MVSGGPGRPAQFAGRSARLLLAKQASGNDCGASRGMIMAPRTASTGLLPVLERQTVQDQVYAQLREALIAGAFEAKETFTIAALADRFQVSHMPVREALRRLAAENALRIAPSGTAYVPALSVAELDDITRARVIIEGATADIAFDTLNAGTDVARLREIILRHDASGMDGDSVGMTAANREFHFYIYRGSHSPVLLSQIENLWLRSGPYVRILPLRLEELVKAGMRDGFTPYHEMACNALAAGNRALFREAIESDILASHRALRNVISDPATS